MKYVTKDERNRRAAQEMLKNYDSNKWFIYFTWLPQYVNGTVYWLTYIERQASLYSLREYDQIYWIYREIEK